MYVNITENYELMHTAALGFTEYRQHLCANVLVNKKVLPTKLFSIVCVCQQPVYLCH